MSLATCANHECGRVLDVPGLPRTYRGPDGRCAKCANLTPEQIMDIPAQVLTALKPIAAAPGVDTHVPLPTGSCNGSTGKTKLPLAQLRAPRPDGSTDSIRLSPQNGEPSQVFVQRTRSTAAKYAKVHGIKLVTRVEGDGIRIWRSA